MARIVFTILLGGILGASLVRFAPGFGVDEQELDLRLGRESILALRQGSAVNENLFAFYFHHLARTLRGDLGVSRTFERPVASLLKERLPETAKSIALSLTLAWTLGLTAAAWVVISRSWSVDLLVSSLAGILLCLPAALLALLFVLAGAPIGLLLALVVFPNIFRYARNLLAHNASQPHVVTALAKGLGKFRILVWHIVVPAAPELLALAGVSISLALTAAIPIEALCDIPGIGQLAWKAALARDLYLLVNLTMIVTAVTLAASSLSDLLAHAVRTRAT